jgi:hypothetical protein
VAEAQIHLNIPEDSEPPIYANIQHDFLPHTEDWAVVVFYRSPECVPPDFNLLDFIDPPAAFSCALQIQGHENWRSLDDPFPAKVLVHGTGAVPVWFVRWPELQAAVADDELTIGELAALPSLLIGSASSSPNQSATVPWRSAAVMKSWSRPARLWMAARFR